ncbi:hypothetical protein, partial [Vibrio alginolyticus]|uniref:hypothetical protein n=1 Tax=Vibrio alginolyticus TaxID=663 RepID=UPI00215D0D77
WHTNFWGSFVDLSGNRVSFSATQHCRFLGVYRIASINLFVGLLLVSWHQVAASFGQFESSHLLKFSSANLSIKMALWC